MTLPPPASVIPPVWTAAVQTELSSVWTSVPQSEPAVPYDGQV